MVNKVQRAIRAVEGVATALDMGIDEFSQRAMLTSILSTPYVGTSQAIEQHKVAYHRALNLKLGISVSQVFESYQNRFGGYLPLDFFLDKTTNTYMRICGVPLIDRLSRRSEMKGQVVWKLQRSLEHGLISIDRKNNERIVRMFPDASSITFAMLMNPATMMKGTYVKGMAQTIGGMALVDKEQAKLTAHDLAAEVQDRLQSRHLLKNKKPAKTFAASHVDPFHKVKKVSFYSDIDERLFILPTYPVTGRTSSARRFPAIMSEELALEINDGSLSDLTEGMNPTLITINSSDMTLYFNRDHQYIVSLEKLLGTKFNKYLPKNEPILSGFAEIQSKLGSLYGDGKRVADLIDDFLQNDVTESDLNDDFSKRLMIALVVRLKFVRHNEDGSYEMIEDERQVLQTIRDMCNAVNPTGYIMANMAARSSE
jgi:hypothetical protein